MQLHDPDHELVLRVGRGDTLAFRELIGRHLNRGVRTAERMLGNRQDAEDVMQEASLKIWNEAARWQPRAKFSTWLYRVVYNACIDRRRKVVPFSVIEMETLEDTAKRADETLMERQRSLQIQQVLQALPERQRMAVILSYYEDASNQEAADVLGLQLGAFQQLLFRARQKLKDELRDHVQEYKKWKTGTIAN